MTSRPSPITPSDELIQQWRHERIYSNPDLPSGLRYLATRAAQWGWDQRDAATEAELQQRADQELEACCEWLNKSPYGASLAVNGVIEQLRVARRPKPPSLKEEALEAARRFYANGNEGRTDEELTDDFHTIRRALGAL